MPKFKFTRRIILGLSFIYLAGLGWGAEFVIPFTDIGHKVIIWLGILIAAELSFIAGVYILGKPIYSELKSRLTAMLNLRQPPQH